MLSPSHLEGRILQNCYRIEKRVGKGGMAWVYKGYHTILNVPVAIKILLPSLAEEESIRQRFVMEAKVMFQLRHPHIVQVTDIIQEGDLLGMVMEWVQGEDLNQWLKRQESQISWRQFWKLCSPFLGAMDYIHRKGFVHRDLKLSNIMLHYDEKEPILKVADFGLVKVLDDMSDENLTQTGTHMGTVAYMSPEQIKDSKNVDERSDIYSVGVVLYKLLTRKVPFTGDVHYVILQHIDSEPPPLRQHRPEIPQAVEEVVMRCLAKNQEDRWESCAVMAEAMRQALLESGSINVEQADILQVSGDPEAAEHTWHSVSQKKYSASQWDKTEPEWMRDRAYQSEIHPSQDNLTIDNADLASELTQMVQPETSSKKLLWMGVSAVVALLIAVVGFVFLRPPPETPSKPNKRRQIQVPVRRVVQTPRVPVPPPRRDPDDDDDDDDTDVELRRPPVVRPAGPRIRPRRRIRRLRPVLMLESSPQGADVWVGSRKVGTTPYRWQGRVGRTVRWTLKRAGYESQSGRWRFSRARLSRNRVQLSRARVSFLIKSKPGRAAVWIRGRRVGLTPYRYKGPVGTSVSFQLKKDKFQVYKGRFKLGAGSSQRVISLKPFINDPFSP